MIRAAIVGATGYTGREVHYWLSRHPSVELVSLMGSGPESVRKMVEENPDLDASLCEPFSLDTLAARKPDVVFLATPPEVSLQMAPGLLQLGHVVIDLSAAFRLRRPEQYDRWYGFQHSAPKLLEQAVYGLPEVHGERIRDAQLIANPGCYPTSLLLALLPFVRQGLIDPSCPIICDSKSGLTGAGKNPEYVFAEINENCQAYKVGSHRHTPELLQELGTGDDVTVAFTPHLVPVNRGILSTIYLRTRQQLDQEELVDLLRAAYRDRRFVRVYDNGRLPQMKHVVGSNFCDIGCVAQEGTRLVTLVSTIDNLVKGAAGQAVQNMNLRFGLNEALGLIPGVH